MAINLEKGQRVNVGLPKFVVGLGWDATASSTGEDFDLDASVFLLGENKKIISDDYFLAKYPPPSVPLYVHLLL